jgi:hypothetical protein
MTVPHNRTASVPPCPTATDPADAWAVNLLHAPGALLCKVIRPGADPVPAQLPRHFDMHALPVHHLNRLSALLARLVVDRECCIIRAAPLDPARTTWVRRLLAAAEDNRAPPTLHDVPRSWCALDMDGAPLPTGCDACDLAACHAAVAATLPAELRDAGCVVQATGSHGIKPGARLRLWYVLSRPCIGADLAAWLAEVPGLDPTCFRPVQVTYTAAPLFAEGAADPLPSRLLTVPGPPACPPPLDGYRRPPPPFGGWEGHTSAGHPDRAVSRFAGLLRTVALAPEGQRHPTLYWAACRAGELVAAGELGREAAAEALAGAAMDGGGRDERNAARTAVAGIARGLVEAR